MLAGCAKDSGTETVVPKVSESADSLILDNPIDQELQWVDDGSMNRIDFAVSYKEAWEAEIVYAMEILQTYLSEADYAELEASYSAWKQYLESMMQVEISLFYIGSEYRREDTGLITGDGATYPRVMEAAAQRTKEYAIELLSLEYALTGKIQFAFGKE